MRGRQFMIGLLVIVAGTALAQEAAGAVTVQTANNATFGDFLTDGSGASLYMFTSDTAATGTTPPVSACTDTCATNWPPLTAAGTPTAGPGIEGTLLGTFARADGSMQVTYNGIPLYYFAKDTAAGDTAGEGVNDMWFLVSPYGVAVKPAVTAASESSAAPAGAADAAAAPTQTMAEQMTAGEAVFNSHCAVCHGAQGEGGTGVKLAGNAGLGDSQLVVKQILKGGRIMPPFGNQLSDSEIAAVATYIRNSWTNEFGSISEQQVSQGRQ